MSKRVYTEIFQGGFKSLGHWMDDLLEEKDNYEFFCCIATCISPLIRKSPIFGRFYFNCIREKDEYFKERAELEKIVPIEVERDFLSLKVSIEEDNDFDNSDIKMRLTNIEQIFANKKRYGMPSYLEEVFVQQSGLLEQLLEIGKFGIVQKYAVIGYRESIRHNPETGAPEKFMKPFIERFTFSPSLTKLLELENICRRGSIELPWVALEYVFLAEWCWDTPKSFFEDKRFSYDDYRETKKSLHLMTLNSACNEIDRIRQKDLQGEQNSIFCRELYIKYMKLIINKLILEQGITAIDALSEEEVVVPYCVQLRLDGLEFFFDIYWFKGGTANNYCLAKYQHIDSGRYKFMKRIFDVPTGTVINVDDVSEVGGANVSKFLSESGLEEIEDLFFEKQRHNKATKNVKMITKSVVVSEISKSRQRKLSKFIINKLGICKPSSIIG